MSDTRRWTQPNWDGETLSNPPKSKKHQQRDRTEIVWYRKYNKRFMKGLKNDLYSLKEKVFQLMDMEHRDYE